MKGKTQKIVCHHHVQEVREYGYMELQTIIHQEFVMIRKLCGVVTSKTRLFIEEVPNWAQLQNNCLGHTEWTSNAPKWMHKAIKRKEWINGWYDPIMETKT